MCVEVSTVLHCVVSDNVCRGSTVLSDYVVSDGTSCV